MFRNIPEIKYNTLKPFAAGIAIALLLAACTTQGGGLNSGLNNSQTQSQVAKVLTPNPSGEVIGSGNVRISLLVPSTIPGGAAAVAQEIRNGAELAIRDFGRNQVQLVVKDTKGQAAEAQARASEAIKEGSSLVLGPLFCFECQCRIRRYPAGQYFHAGVFDRYLRCKTRRLPVLLYATV